MPAPFFQFYPGDWLRNANLRRCTHAERGAWIDVMCLMHDSEAYGLLRWPLKEIAKAIGAPLPLLRGLADKGVLKGCDSGTCEPFTYTPRTGGKKGPAVVLVDGQFGPIWYSTRMLRDEHVRNARAGTPKPPIGTHISMANGSHQSSTFPANSKQHLSSREVITTISTREDGPW